MSCESAMHESLSINSLQVPALQSQPEELVEIVLKIAQFLSVSESFILSRFSNHNILCNIDITHIRGVGVATNSR